MKKSLFLSLITLLFIGLVACGSTENTSTSGENKIQESGQSSKTKESELAKTDGEEAFENYMNSITPILQEIGQWGQKYEDLRTQSVNGQVTDEEFAATISEELLPEGIKIQEKMEGIMPEKDFRDAHEKMNQMLAKNNQAFTEIIAAVNSGDASKLTSANSLLTEARELERQAYYDLKDLADKYGVPFGE